MSGRSCSVAWSVFFSSDGVAREKALDRPEAEVVAALGERLTHLFKGDVGCLLEQRQDQGLAGVDTTGPPVAA
jgi:hypothetical protein